MTSIRCLGLYTSPHLVAVRERIRINGVPISEEDFARFFFEVWDKLVENDRVRLSFNSARTSTQSTNAFRDGYLAHL